MISMHCSCSKCGAISTLYSKEYLHPSLSNLWLCYLVRIIKSEEKWVEHVHIFLYPAIRRGKRKVRECEVIFGRHLRHRKGTSYFLLLSTGENNSYQNEENIEIKYLVGQLHLCTPWTLWKWPHDFGGQSSVSARLDKHIHEGILVYLCCLTDASIQVFGIIFQMIKQLPLVCLSLI